jgi:uncharacterized protein
MKMRLRFSGGLFILGWLVCSLVFAFEIPAQPDNYVNDYANMLSANATATLNQELDDFEKKTSTQLVVVTIPSLDDQPIEDYSIHLAERWKIGTHQHDNGIILLLSKAEHRIRIEVGYGLEGALPDALAEQIIQNEIRPSLQQGNFDAGIEHGVTAIMQATQNEYHAKTTHSTMDNNSILGEIIGFIILTIILLRVIGLLREGLLAAMGLSARIHTPFWDAVASSIIIGGVGGGSGGAGGFGGGGGGSFGGGGASGGW